MTENLQQYGIVPALQEVFDHSFSGLYEECQRYALYQGIWGRRGKVENYTLVWGGLFHKIAKVWVDTQDLNQVIELVDLNLPDDIVDKYGRTKTRMQEAFLKWAQYRRDDPLEILRTEQPAVIDCRSACPYSENGCGLLYGGKLDEIVKWNAMIGPLDIKTTVMTVNDPIQEYKPSHQMEGYVWIASHLMGKHCWGVIVERVIINKSKIEPSRFPVPYSKDMIREWVEDERERQAEIRAKFEAHATDEIKWRQNKARCYKPYPCPFRDVCTSPREAGFRLRWLRDNTVERRFDFRHDEPSDPAE